MKEIIGNYANNIGTAAMLVTLCAYTVEAVAKDNAMWAAIWSPITVILLILYAAIWSSTSS